MPIDKLRKRSYSIVPHDPDWAVQYASIKTIIQKTFQEKALTISHVGSTSIPDMSGKEVIDVLITVNDIHDLVKEKKLMEEQGYIWGENYIAPETVFCVREDTYGNRLQNIHICLAGSPKALQFIHVTDYLRSHPERAAAYAALKKELCKEYPTDYPAYRAAKQPFLEETRKLAYEWAGIDDPGDIPFI